MQVHVELLWDEERVQKASAALGETLERVQARARSRRVDLEDFLPKGTRSLLEGLAQLPPSGAVTMCGGEVAKAYAANWTARTTVATLAWVKAPTGFPAGVALAASRERLNSMGELPRRVYEEVQRAAAEALRSTLPKLGLEEPLVEKARGLLQFRKRLLEPRWEMVGVGGVWLPYPPERGDPFQMTPEGLARALAQHFRISSKLFLAAIEEESSSEELVRLLILEAMG